MARSPIFDPKTSEARSSWLAGLTYVCNMLTGVLDMKTDTFSELQMPELYISEKDRYRIFEIDSSHKCWLQNPSPVIKKNGVVINEDNDGFTIDYLGGSIAFEDAYKPSADDVITASATYIVSGSNQLSNILTKLDELSQGAAKNFDGYYNTFTDLEAASGNLAPEAGDYAIVQDTNSIYIWNDSLGQWVDTYKIPDLSGYYTKEDMDALLGQKEDNIAEHGSSNEDDAWYYGGRKLWVNVYEKVLGTVLAGVVFTDNSEITSDDTVLTALGKLQAQIHNNIHPITGPGEPTSETIGQVGQDYINTSTGAKWHMVSVENGVFKWEQYADVSKLEEDIKPALDQKQDKILGTSGQVVSFDGDGNMVAVPVADAMSDYLPLAGGTMTGAISMGGNKIASLVAPTEEFDAVNKKYVDDIVGNISVILDSINGEEAAVLAEQIITDSWEESY